MSLILLIFITLTPRSDLSSLAGESVMVTALYSEMIACYCMFVCFVCFLVERELLILLRKLKVER